MIKRLFDIIVAFIGLLIASPVLIVVMLLVWLQDFHSPFYVAPRIGNNGKTFKMVKLRSMVVNAENVGGDSTSADDSRITPIGRFIRRYKIDEMMQLWNVFVGHMSLVGPRPNVWHDVKLYTEEEKKLLSVKPGITDISSIVFADEGAILRGSLDPDLKYNQIIRPWKSRLGLLYVERASIIIDLRLLVLTATAIFSRSAALRGIQKLLEGFEIDSSLLKIARRDSELKAFPPPGAAEIVQSR